MRKKVLIALAVGFVLTLNMYACSDNAGSNTEKSTTQDVKEAKKEKSSSAAEISKEEEKSSSSTEQSEKETLSDEGDLGEYYVKIKDAVQSKDDNGQPMLVVHYDFANNGSETDSPYWALAINAYQDGTLLDTAFANDNPDYDYDIENQEVSPGESVEDCQHAFVLTGTGKVEFEVQQLVDPEAGKLGKTFTLE